MGKNSILIVDDDLILLKTAEEILSSIYTVSVAKNGKQAITLLKKGVVPDLILLDIAMPEMDGYTTLEKMKSIPNCQDIPVIFLTGFAESDYEVKGLKAGAVDYIVKPFVKEVLLARVEMHLERSAKETGKSFADAAIEKNRGEIQKKADTNRMEDCAGSCTGNGKPGDCGTDELFLWICEKCDCPYLFQVRN